VDFLWAFDASGGGPARERVLPTATNELVVPLGADRAHPIICGAHSEFFEIDTAVRPALIGAHFKPGGAVPFLRMPADELGNVRLPLEAVWGRAASALRERLLEAGTWAARFRILEAALLARLAGAPARHPAVMFALHPRLPRVLRDESDGVPRHARSAAQPHPTVELRGQIFPRRGGRARPE
jgi:hypothetical protein